MTIERFQRLPLMTHNENYSSFAPTSARGSMDTARRHTLGKGDARSRRRNTGVSCDQTRE